MPEWGDCSYSAVGEVAVVKDHQFTVTFDDMSESLKTGVRVCYKYGDELWMGYDYVLVPIRIDVMTTTDNLNAVLGVQKTYFFKSDYARLTDTYKWVKKSSGGCADDDSDAMGAGVRTLSPSEDGQLKDDVIFTQSAKGAELALCWKFTTGPYFFIDYITMHILSVDSFAPEFGRREFIMVNAPKEYLIEAYGQKAEDRVLLAASNDLLCAQPLASYRLARDLKSVELLVTVANAEGYRVCYQFAEEGVQNLDLHLTTVSVDLVYNEHVFLNRDYVVRATGDVHDGDSLVLIKELSQAYDNATTHYVFAGRRDDGEPGGRADPRRGRLLPGLLLPGRLLPHSA